MPTPLKLIAIIALLQPLYLAMLIATDFIAPPQARMLHLQIQPPISLNEDSECGAQSIGLEPGASPLRNAIVAASPRAKTTPMTLCEALHRTAIADLSNIVWVPLDRYWHGYRVVIDPLTAWFSWRSTRLVALALLASALVYFALASAERPDRDHRVAGTDAGLLRFALALDPDVLRAPDLCDLCRIRMVCETDQ